MCPSGRTLHAAPAGKSDFRSAFDVLDADRDGRISRDDLRAFYSGFSGCQANDDVIGSMISAADSNQDGYVEYEEFERVLGCKRQRVGVGGGGGVMEDVFRAMDKDGDGRLSHEDLKSYLKSAGFSASDDDVGAMIRLGGGNENGGVSYDGFLKILAVDGMV